MSGSRLANIYKKIRDFDKTYIYLYLFCLLFLMRWNIIYAKSLEELLNNNLPYQLFALCLGIGMQFLISMVLKAQSWRRNVIVGLVYFAILLTSLIKTDLLWNRYSDPQTTVLFVIIIGLLRIIEKHKIGVFAGGNKKRLKTVMCIIFAFFFAVDFAHRFPGETRIPSVRPVTDTDTQALIDKNMDKLKNLQDSRWKKLDINERLDVMQTVANIEASHLGIGHTLIVRSGKLDNYSYAIYKDHMIIINEKMLENIYVTRMLASVAHESYHAYQARSIDVYKLADEKTKKLLWFRQIGNYEKEWHNYKDGRADYEGYYNQALEADARTYSRQRQAYYDSLLMDVK